MSKHKAAAQPDSGATAAPHEISLNRWLKGLISIVLAWHVAAVFVAPLTFASDAASPFANALAALFRPYTAAMYLNHGYFFFAPNPGPSHLVDYTVEFNDGRPPLKGRFPNLATEWPRLLYHRHFMLAEALNNQYAPPERPPEPSPPPLTASVLEKARYQVEREDYARGLAGWQHQRRQYEAMWQSFQEHLQSKYGAQRVALTRVEHGLLSPAEVQYGQQRLDAPETYRNLSETTPRGESR